MSRTNSNNSVTACLTVASLSLYAQFYLRSSGTGAAYPQGLSKDVLNRGVSNCAGPEGSITMMSSRRRPKSSLT